MNNQPLLVIAAATILLAASGCPSQTSDTKLEPKPRPVEVRVLEKSEQASDAMVSAPVGSWKTEDIGMEVGGRIESVVEPNTYIEVWRNDQDGNPVPTKTPIATINKERFELQVTTQTQQKIRVEQAILAATIEIESTLKAQLEAAVAEQTRAQEEYDRSERLFEKNAGAESDVVRDKAALSIAKAQIKQIEATVSSKTAERESLRAELSQAKDALRDAERNLDDCTLYSSFPGQIVDVSVVPGSIVKAGEPIATIQMMDPIKVEVEVSAETSRRLRNRQRIPIRVPRNKITLASDSASNQGDLGLESERGPEGVEGEQHYGYLYLVDAVADAQTRTFTLTLLVFNERLTDDKELPDVPTTEQTWRIDLPFLPGAKDGQLYATKNTIYEDDMGFFVWRVANMLVNEELPLSRMLKVSKMRIEKTGEPVPFLGKWDFQPIKILDEAIDPKTTLIAAPLVFANESTENWDGETVLFQRNGQWLLRPGDLVKVDLSDAGTDERLYVPMDALAFEDDKTFLFLLDESDSTVHQVEVNAPLDTKKTSVMIAVSSMDPKISIEGRKYVTQGAHFLNDGQTVRAVPSEAGQ